MGQVVVYKSLARIPKGPSTQTGNYPSNESLNYEKLRNRGLLVVGP